MDENKEVSIVTGNHTDEYKKQLNTFRRNNTNHFSEIELEKIIYHVQTYAIQKCDYHTQSRPIAQQKNDLVLLLDKMQDIMDSMRTVGTEAERYTSILTLFDCLPFEAHLPVMQNELYDCYVDIADINLLTLLKDDQKNIIIGVNQFFITALAQCAEWHLYQMDYDKNFPLKSKAKSAHSISQMSAIGLFKRIIVERHQKRIRFFFKDNLDRRWVTYQNLKSIGDHTIILHHDKNVNKITDDIPFLFGDYVEHRIRKNSGLSPITICLRYGEGTRRRSIKEERFYKQCLKSLVRIHQKEMHMRHSCIVLERELAGGCFVNYILDDHILYMQESASLASEGTTVIDKIQDAWYKNAIMFRI